MAKAPPKSEAVTSSPKCSRCVWFVPLAGAWGECKEPTSAIFVDEAIARHVHKPRFTPDLGLCSMFSPQD